MLKLHHRIQPKQYTKNMMMIDLVKVYLFQKNSYKRKSRAFMGVQGCLVLRWQCFQLNPLSLRVDAVILCGPPAVCNRRTQTQGHR